MKKCLLLFIIVLSFSCGTKKQINYLQDSDTNTSSTIVNSVITIQPKDILKITVTTLIPEAAIPYNKSSSGSTLNQNIETMKLDGYIVSENGSINFPVLGQINVKGKTTRQLETELKETLEQGGHLKNPTVSIRLLNAKFTVLGEVNKPGTFSFTEEKLTVFQALGFAGDLSITGEREDILLIRENNGKRQVSHINLKTSDWFETDLYHIKPNDVIMVNPNTKKIKSAGLIGDTSTLIGVASLVISITILLTN